MEEDVQEEEVMMAIVNRKINQSIKFKKRKECGKKNPGDCLNTDLRFSFGATK